MKVRIIPADRHPAYRREDEIQSLIGLVGTLTGRTVDELVEVKIINPQTGKPFGYLFYPEEFEDHR